VFFLISLFFLCFWVGLCLCLCCGVSLWVTGDFFFVDSVSFTLIFLRVFVYFLSVYGRLQEYSGSNLFGGFVFCLTLIFFCCL